MASKFFNLDELLTDVAQLLARMDAVEDRVRDLEKLFERVSRIERLLAQAEPVELKEPDITPKLRRKP